jgi:hypothetical protein
VPVGVLAALLDGPLLLEVPVAAIQFPEHR